MNDRTTAAVTTRQQPEPESNDAELSFAPGGTLDRYVVLSRVGRGGMGHVLRAYDPKLQREVALKVVRSRSLTDAARRRALDEACAMAQVAHPNVVSVFDVHDTTAGAVLAMEYVSGSDLRRWTEERRPWREVVERYRQAGRGLVAAHEARILHRDFKPANVLISESGVAKVTDFGLAQLRVDWATPDAKPRSTLSDGSGSGTDSAPGASGTPAYMPPEQHEGRPLTAAADQYALCAALWQGLCGTPPFAGKGRALLEHKLAGPPAWPDTASGVPRPIVEAIRRGLSVKPSERWPDVATLVRALGHDPTRRRARWLMAGAGVAFVAVAGVWGHSLLQSQARRCTGASEQLVGVWDEPRRAEVTGAIEAVDLPFAGAIASSVPPVLDRYAEQWEAAHTEACEATSIRGEQSQAIMDLRMRCLQRARTDLLATVEELAKPDAALVGRAHGLVSRLPPLSDCADVEALMSEAEPPSAADADRVAEARTLLRQQSVLRNAGRLERAQQQLQRAEEIGAAVEYPPLAVDLELERGLLHDAAGEHDEAEATLRRALEMAARGKHDRALFRSAFALFNLVGYQRGDYERALAYRDLVAGLARGLPRREAAWRSLYAMMLAWHEDLPQAESVARQGLAQAIEAHGERSNSVARSRGNLAWILLRRGKLVEAEEQFRQLVSVFEQLLGPDHPMVGVGLRDLAAVRIRLERLDEAQATLDRAARIYATERGQKGPGFPLYVVSQADLAFARGDFALGETKARQALTLAEQRHGPSHSQSVAMRSLLAQLVARQGRYAEAEKLLRDSIASADDPKHAVVRIARGQLGSVLIDQERYDEAEALLREVLYSEDGEAEPAHAAQARRWLAELRLARGDLESARSLAQAAVDSFEEIFPPGHRASAGAIRTLAAVELAEGRPKLAVQLAEPLVETLTKRLGPTHPQVLLSQRTLAIALAADGQQPRARGLLASALEAMATRFGAQHPETVATRAALAELR